MQRAHAPAADRVRRNVESGSKSQGLGTIHNLAQGLLVNITQRRMEKAGADLA
jgi:hypothetical protein